MSITDQFWQYAKEAILSASFAKTDEERQGLLELSRTWTRAALLERQSTNQDTSRRGGPVFKILDDTGNLGQSAGQRPDRS
jgi:hypothetical protein